MLTRGCLVLCTMSLIGFVIDSAILSSFSNQLPVPDIRVILPVLIALFLPNQVGVILSFLVGLSFDLLSGGIIGINCSAGVLVFICALVFLGNLPNGASNNLRSSNHLAQNLARNLKRKISSATLFTGCLFAYFTKIAFENFLYSKILSNETMNISISLNQFMIGFVTALFCPIILQLITKISSSSSLNRSFDNRANTKFSSKLSPTLSPVITTRR